MNNTPKIFISSTIYDFKDLRSALKFYLEQLGYIVYTSENNDFKVDGSVHSYDACLKLIRECDYFILLIGSRVGGWYNKENKVSITRQEYKTAYELHRQGKLEIISFVRSDVWQLKESRNELAKHLHNLNFLEKETKESVLNFPTKFANDAEFVSDFIMEVGRNAETNKALKENGELPTGNWIRQFDSFRDIIDALSGLINLGSLDYKLNLEILKNELDFYISKTNEILRNNPDILYITSNNLIRNLKREKYSYNKILLDKDNWELFISIFWYTSVIHYIPIDIQILNSILTSKTLFKFNSKNQSFQKSPIYDDLISLKNNINNFKKADIDISEYVEFTNNMKETYKLKGYYLIEQMQLTKIISRAGTISNIFNLANSIVKSIDSGLYQEPKLFDFDSFVLKVIDYTTIST